MQIPEGNVPFIVRDGVRWPGVAGGAYLTFYPPEAWPLQVGQVYHGRGISEAEFAYRRVLGTAGVAPEAEFEPPHLFQPRHAGRVGGGDARATA